MDIYEYYIQDGLVKEYKHTGVSLGCDGYYEYCDGYAVCPVCYLDCEEDEVYIGYRQDIGHTLYFSKQQSVDLIIKYFLIAFNLEKKALEDSHNVRVNSVMKKIRECERIGFNSSMDYKSIHCK